MYQPDRQRTHCGNNERTENVYDVMHLCKHPSHSDEERYCPKDNTGGDAKNRNNCSKSTSQKRVVGREPVVRSMRNERCCVRHSKRTRVVKYVASKKTEKITYRQDEERDEQELFLSIRNKKIAAKKRDRKQICVLRGKDNKSVHEVTIIPRVVRMGVSVIARTSLQDAS